MPEKFGGPKFWRRFIEAKPESTYGAYAGSTYPGSKPGGLDSFRILFNNLLQFLLGNESEDGAKVAGWDWRGRLRAAAAGSRTDGSETSSGPSAVVSDSSPIL